jgi:hypothetical protein
MNTLHHQLTKLVIDESSRTGTEVIQVGRVHMENITPIVYLRYPVNTYIPPLEAKTQEVHMVWRFARSVK